MREIAGTIFLIFIFVTVILPISAAILTAALPLLPLFIIGGVFYWWVTKDDPGPMREDQSVD